MVVVLDSQSNWAGRAGVNGQTGISGPIHPRLLGEQPRLKIWRGSSFNNLAGIHVGESGFFNINLDIENTHYPFVDNNTDIQTGPTIFAGDALLDRYEEIFFYCFAIGGTPLTDLGTGARGWDTNISGSLTAMMQDDFKEMKRYATEKGWILNILFFARLQGESDATYCANNPGLYIDALSRVYDSARQMTNSNAPLYIVPPILDLNDHINTEMHEYCSAPANNARMVYLDLKTEFGPAFSIAEDGTHLELDYMELIGKRLAYMHLNPSALPLYPDIPVLSNIVLAGGNAVGEQASISFDYSHNQSLAQSTIEIDWYVDTDSNLNFGGLRDLTPTSSSSTYTPVFSDENNFLAARIRVAANNSGSDLFSRYYYVKTDQAITGGANFTGTTNVLNYGTYGSTVNDPNNINETQLWSDHDFLILKREYSQLRNPSVVRPARDLYIQPDLTNQITQRINGWVPIMSAMQVVTSDMRSVMNTTAPMQFPVAGQDGGNYRHEININFASRGISDPNGYERSELPGFYTTNNPFVYPNGWFIYFSEAVPVGFNVNYPGFGWNQAPANPDAGHFAISMSQLKKQAFTTNPSFATFDIKMMGPDTGIKSDQGPITRLGIQRTAGRVNDWAIYVKTAGDNTGRIQLWHKFHDQVNYTLVYELLDTPIYEKEGTDRTADDSSPLFDTGNWRWGPYPNVRTYNDGLGNIILGYQDEGTDSNSETIPDGYFNAGQAIQPIVNPIKMVLMYVGYRGLSATDTVTGTLESIRQEVGSSSITVPNFNLV